jgi:hypothetical protein
MAAIVRTPPGARTRSSSRVEPGLAVRVEELVEVRLAVLGRRQGAVRRVDVLVEMGDAEPAARLVARAGEVKQLDRDVGRGPVLVDDDAQAVGERERVDPKGDGRLGAGRRRHKQDAEDPPAHGRMLRPGASGCGKDRVNGG